MTLDQLRIFIAVAHGEHVGRAARSLNLTQSAVSSSIATLESRHGVHLFHRVGRGIELTGEGRAFLAEARAVVTRAAEAQRMLDDLAGLKHGRLSLVASQTIASYWLPAILTRFKARYPGIAIEVLVGNSAQAAASVRDGSAELGFVEGTVDDPALAHWQVGEDALVLIGRDLPENPDAGWLRSTQWVVREKGSGTRAALEAALIHRGLTMDDLDIVLTFPSNEAVLNSVASGAGVSVLSTLLAAPLIASGRIASASFDLPARPFYALRHKERYRSKAADALLEMIG